MSEKSTVVREGYVVKDKTTGELDIDTNHPLTLRQTKLPHHELVDGYEWVKVRITYKEVLYCS